MPQTILVTGASRGVGLELARQAAARGDAVLATARALNEAEGLTRARAEAEEGPGSIAAFGLDVTEPARVEELAQTLSDRAIDLLVCNAGVLNSYGGVDDPAHSADAWTSVLMTNVAGVFFTVRAFLPMVKRSRSGRIAIISSGMGSSERASGGAYPYRASKAGATNLARNFAADLKGEDVAVGAYHPGWVRTDMGGPRAAIDPAESAAGLLTRFDELTLKSTGVFEDYKGAAIPY